MQTSYLLPGETAQTLYGSVGRLPIIDYHCHLSPMEIYEDKPFDNIGEMWLRYDHYKWRLMRTAGVPEELITGNASWHDKFIAFAGALEFAANNPLYHWSHMELSMYFGIDLPLRSDTAEKIWAQANRAIREKELSPRKLIAQSAVETICTTDDIADTLEWHEKLRDDQSFSTAVLPSFRTDNVMLMLRDGYGEYLNKLSAAVGIKIDSLDALKKAMENRLEFFVAHGCKCTDVGMPYFPDRVSGDAEADTVFRAVLAGEKPTMHDYLGLIGNLYLFLGALYQKYGLVMQWHLAVTRNSNTVLFARCGGDCGVDCVGDPVNGGALIAMLDAINQNSGLPRTVLYTLNGANAAQIASIAGAFPGVQCGAAWWFCDHKRGIEEEIDIIAENSCLGGFLGMLTDSRSFLSYARHDYFRRILCAKIASWVDAGEYDADSAQRLAYKICYENVKNLFS